MKCFADCKRGDLQSGQLQVALAETDLELAGRRKASSLASGVTRTGARCARTADARFTVLEADTEAVEAVKEAMLQN